MGYRRDGTRTHGFVTFLGILCTIASLVLTFLCFFAGSRTSFLSQVPAITVSLFPSSISYRAYIYVVQLDTTQFGKAAVGVISSSNANLGALLAALPPDIRTALEENISLASRKLGLHDFYDIHIMTYCEGYYTPSPNDTDVVVPPPHTSRNVTECSKLKAVFETNPKDIFLGEIYRFNNLTQKNLGLSLSQSDIDGLLNWPKDVTDALSLAQRLEKGLFILFIVDLVLIFLALVFATIGIAGRVLSSVWTVLFAILAVLSSIVTSVYATVFVYVAVKAINNHTSNIGVTAIKGSQFLWFNWGASIAMIVAILLWSLEVCIRCCSGRGVRRSHPNERQQLVR